MIGNSIKPNCAIVGYGKVGIVLAKALVEKDYPLLAVVSRHLERDAWLDSLQIPIVKNLSGLPVDLDFVALCVRDSQIRELANAIARRGGFKKGTVVAHTAGAVSAEILEKVKNVGALPLAWHPMQTFIGGEGAGVLNDITFGIDGDEEAVEIGKAIAADLGGIPYLVSPEKRAVYHLSAVVACNLMSGLISMAMRLLNDAGMSDEQAQRTLAPLIVKTAQNIAADGLPQAISGPHRRGDADTIIAHIEILRNYPEIATVYKRLSMEIFNRLGDRELDDRLKSLMK